MFRNVKKEEITVPAQMSYLIQVRQFIEHIGKRYRYSEKLINSFKLVVDEACTNIIRHGYRDIKNGEIQLLAIIRRLSLTIVITDQGISYDPRQANTPDLAKYVDIGKKGGLGILMMRKLMDDIQYVVTERGNEFRLTKFKDKADESRPMQIWNSLNMRTRYSLISSFILTLIIVIIFSMLFMNLKDDVENEVFGTLKTSVKSLADNSAIDVANSDAIPMFENIKTVYSNSDIQIYDAFITNTDGRILARMIGGKTAYGQFNLPEDFNIIDSLENVVIRKYTINDTLDVFDISSNIYPIQSTSPLGRAHVRVATFSVDEIATGRQVTLIITLIIILAIGYAGSFYLVSQILKSFHSLADWVRQVVHGKVDQDEIDIDTSDEIGEIAQAFNEMTSKFRKAQVNLIEQQKLQKELQVAQEIQQMLLPSDFPKVDGFDIGSYYEAAKEVGGDLFDFVEVDEETVGIIVADVSGKGVPGSLIMTMIRTALRLESRGNKNPADVLARVNHFVSEDMRKGMFVTMFYVILDSRNRVIHYASAGHNPMILYRSSSKQTYYLNPSGFPVGLQLPDQTLFEKKIQTDSILLREDDILVLYTDGITEAMNHKRELYREERFLQSIRNNGHLDVAEFVKSIKDDLKDYTGGAMQNDDITFVAIKEKLMPGEIIYKTHRQMVELISNGMRVKDACDQLKISQYQYYKYKTLVDEGGLDALRNFLEGKDYIEKKHLSIELKSKVFDIIKENPKQGPKKIAAALATEKYGSAKIDERLIYNELVKLRLNTPARRQRFVEKGHHNRLKQPGTPLLTLDGSVILDFESSEQQISKTSGETPQELKSDTPSQEEKKPFVRQMSSGVGDDRKTKPHMMHQTGKTFDPSRQKPEAPKPPVVEKPKPVTPVPPPVVKPKEVDQVIVPTVDQLKKKATEKLDAKLVNQLYYECKDDFDAITELVKKMKKETVSEAEMKKINLILKIVLKNPILKKLVEINQLIGQAQNLFELLQEKLSSLQAETVIQNAESVLNYLQKENILDTSTSIIEKTNRLGLMYKRLNEQETKQVQSSNLDNIRNKIAQRQLVKDDTLIQMIKQKK